MISFQLTPIQQDLHDKVIQFINEEIIPYEKDPRLSSHGIPEDVRQEMIAKAKQAGVFGLHLPKKYGGQDLSHVDQAVVFEAAGTSPLGPVAMNCAAPDEANMFLLDKLASQEQKTQWLEPLTSGDIRSCFAATEPFGAGADPSQLKTTARREGNKFVINGHKWLITGATGSSLMIIYAMVEGDDGGPTLFMVPSNAEGIEYKREMDTLDNSFAGGHSELIFNNLQVMPEQVLGDVGGATQAFQIRLSPARLTHCMRWLGGACRAHEIALDYARRRQAFGKRLGDHEGVGFMLADNEIDLQQSRLMIWWAAEAMDLGRKARHESSLVKTSVAEALYRVTDRCVQILGGMGVTNDTIVAQLFRELRCFRIYDGPSEVHRFAIARRILGS